MGEKASVFQTAQIGIQSLVGTAVPADKKLLACSVIPSVSVEADQFTASGNKYPSFVTVNKDWSAVDVTGKLTYNEILYLLASLLSQPTPTQQGATTAYKWTFLSDTDGEDAGKSLTIEQGDANSAWRSKDVRLAGLELTFNRSEVSFSGSGLGGPMETGITLTAAPTSLTPKPILPAHLKFYIADTQAGLAGASAMTRGFSLVWGLTDKINLAWPVGNEPVVVEKEPKLEAKLKLASDTVGMGLLATMRSGATKWCRIKATGALIASTYYYDLQLDFPAQISNVGKLEDQEGIYAMEYTMAVIHDATWGKAFQLDIITDVQTL
ncbi:MAG: hypothetical protein CVU46_11080 [Chloroflexi bacterium HGW-Chloroflexi-8]|nr:MAG: hypothetical protein CVU46_11080 [Chloroflexi bacterium HGW-Chloroflexi-8]